MDENSQTSEFGSVSSSEGSQVETVQIDYSDQLLVVTNQQQIMIGLCAIILGVLLAFAFMSIFSRFI